jgi:hypothetical protein
MSCYVVDGTPEEPRRRRRIGNGHDLTDALTAAYRRLDRPIMLTETSVSGGIRHRQRWLDDSVAAVARARAGGAHVMGYTWFPAFSLVAWSYRRGRKPVEAYFAHMGLWDLQLDANGTLLRVPTGLERRFADLVAAGAMPVGGREPGVPDEDVA